jgi:hypothetical protein
VAHVPAKGVAGPERLRGGEQGRRVGQGPGEDRVRDASLWWPAGRRVDREPAGALVGGRQDPVGNADRVQGEVTRDQAMDAPGGLEDQHAIQDVEHFLERVDVSGQPATRVQVAD